MNDKEKEEQMDSRFRGNDGTLEEIEELKEETEYLEEETEYLEEETEDLEEETDDIEIPLTILEHLNPLLRKTSGKVHFIDDEMLDLIEDMSTTMVLSRGIGLAAPQVGLNKRFFIFISDLDELDSDDPVDVHVAINPQILSRDGANISYEGCLSYPKHVASVKRALVIKTRYYDINMNKVEEEYSGLAARVFQHEMDHLDGILFTDRMEPDTLKHIDDLNDDDVDNEDIDNVSDFNSVSEEDKI